MLRFALVVAGALTATPALAESYNIVCPIAALGTEQAAGATIARGYIFSLDFDAMQGCQRVDNACTPAAFTIVAGVAELAAKDTLSAEFNTESNVLTIAAQGADKIATVTGNCRRAPFTPF